MRLNIFHTLPNETILSTTEMTNLVKTTLALLYSLPTIGNCCNILLQCGMCIVTITKGRASSSVARTR